MMLSLDYDDTYTRDPIFWDAVIVLATQRGHSVICVTARSEQYRQEVTDALASKVEAILCTNGKAKFLAAHRAGYMPSVWIDDAPQWVHADAFGGQS